MLRCSNVGARHPLARRTAHGGFPLTRRRARTPRSLFEEHGAPKVIDYWSLDTEGSELAILRSFPWGDYAFRVLTVEHNHLPVRDEIRALLENKGYRRERAIGIDDCYVRVSAP